MPLEAQTSRCFVRGMVPDRNAVAPPDLIWHVAAALDVACDYWHSCTTCTARPALCQLPASLTAHGHERCHWCCSGCVQGTDAGVRRGGDAQQQLQPGAPPVLCPQPLRTPSCFRQVAALAPCLLPAHCAMACAQLSKPDTLADIGSSADHRHVHHVRRSWEWAAAGAPPQLQQRRLEGSEPAGRRWRPAVRVGRCAHCDWWAFKRLRGHMYLPARRRGMCMCAVPTA